MVFKKCTGCNREFTKSEFEEIQARQKKSKGKSLKNTCPHCNAPLKTYDESRFQKKWCGYINIDKSLIEHLVLVEFHYYDDDSFEVRVPLLELTFETKVFSEAINKTDDSICTYLETKFNKTYDNEHKFLTQAYIKETISNKQDIQVWWQ